MKAPFAALAACCAVHLGLVGAALGWAAWSWSGTAVAAAAGTMLAVVVAVHRRRTKCPTDADARFIG